MSPEGTVGVAAGEGGEIYRSTDAGVEWTKVTGVTDRGPCPSTVSGPLGDNLFSVHFASASVVYVTGAKDDVLKSTNGGASFGEVNQTSNACIVQREFGDTAWRSETVGYLLSNEFGIVCRTTDGMSGVGGTTRLGEALNELQGGARLAIDAEDPLRMWAINPGGSALNFTLTTNGGTSWPSATLSDGATSTSFNDIAAGIGTNVVAVGSAGAIYTSTDGVSFTRNPADAPNATNAWEAVAFQPGTTTAWIGGVSGALLTTNQSNVVPSPPASSLPAGSSGQQSTTVPGGLKRRNAASAASRN